MPSFEFLENDYIPYDIVLKAMQQACEITKQACIEQVKKDSPDKTYSCTSIKNNVIIK